MAVGVRKRSEGVARAEFPDEGKEVGSARGAFLTCATVIEPEALAVQLEDVHMVGEAVEQRSGEALGAEALGPLVEGQIGGNYVESRVKLPDFDSPSRDPFSTGPEFDLRASVGARGAG